MQHPGPKWVVIQRNRTSGTGLRRNELLKLVRRLKSHGFTPRLFAARERLDQFIADPNRRAAVVCIVAAGGDGTVADVVNRCGGLPVAILPLGTENLLARHLKIPDDGAEVADLIAVGCKLRLDAWSLNDRRFLIMAGVGIDAEIVRRTATRRRGNIHKLSYAVPLLMAFSRYRFPELRVFADGDEQPTPSGLVIAANLPVYALGLRIADSAVGNDGLLDLRLFEHRSGFQSIRYLYKVIKAEHESLPDVGCRQVRRLRIESLEPAPVQVDGDFVGWTPATIEPHPEGWEVFVPEANRR